MTTHSNSASSPNWQSYLPPPMKSGRGDDDQNVSTTGSRNQSAAVMTRGFSGKFTEEAFLSTRAGIRQKPTPRPDFHGARPASAPHAAGRLPPLKVTATRFARAVKLFSDSEVGWKAKWMFVILLALLCGVNGLTVANSYVGRNFMTAIAERHMAEFVRQATFYVAVFAASTVVTVIARFLEERLGLLWPDNLTRRIVNLYLADGVYLPHGVLR